MLAELTTAYGIVKTAIANGQEIHQIATKIGKYVGLIEEAESQHRKERSRNGVVGGELEEALDTWQTVKAIREQEIELKNMIIMQTGNINAWNEIVQIRTNIRKEKINRKKIAEAKRRQLVENAQKVTLSLLLFVFLAVAIIITIVLVQKY